MNPEQKEQLENEQIEGSKAQHTYDSFIKEFVEDKRMVLFESFRALPLTAEPELMEVKRMLYAVDTLEQEIMTVIQTGQMASKTLNESNEEVTH
jgi:hypothetical protein